jgi:cell division protein FtsN
MKTQPVPFRRQRGGAFLGFVIGALFGLALALAVAVYVAKVPIPFINKVQPRSAEPDPQKSKDWNPNANLPGRLPPKPEASPAAEPAPEASAPAAPGAAPAPAPAARTGDPSGDLAKSRSEAPSRPTPAEPPPAGTQAADPFQYFVQAGAFRQADEAEQQRARLLLLGLQARVSEREQAGRMVYRVRLGPFDRRDEADKTLERLEGAGVSAVVVRVQR